MIPKVTFVFEYQIGPLIVIVGQSLANHLYMNAVKFESQVFSFHHKISLKRSQLLV